MSLGQNQPCSEAILSFTKERNYEQSRAEQSSKRLRRFGIVVTMFAAALASCTQLSPIQSDQPPTLEIQTSSTRFQKGETIALSFKIQAFKHGQANLQIFAPPNVEILETSQSIDLKPGNQEIKVLAKLKRAGFQSITASLISPEEREPSNDMFSFNVATADATPRLKLAAANLNGSGVETLENHIKELPVVSDNSVFTEQVKADLENRDNVRDDFIMKDVKAIQDGKEITLPTEAVSYLWGTGAGQPAPGTLERLPPTNATRNAIRPQSNCGTRLGTVEIKIKSPDFAGTVYPLAGFIVNVFDHNGIWPHTLIAQGVLNAEGKFSYTQPICDTDSPWWGDYTGPDIYYVINANIPNTGVATPLNIHDGIRVLVTTAAQHGVGTNDIPVTVGSGIRTGIWWENSKLDDGKTHSMTMNASENWSTKALWIGTMTKWGQDFLSASMNKKIGVAIFWPAFVEFGYAYAPGSRIILPDAQWQLTYPLVHEFGHNVRYQTSHPNWYAGCLGNFFPCSPFFGSGFAGLNYYHAYDEATSKEIALNEAMAQTFYEFASQDVREAGFFKGFQSYFQDCLLDANLTSSSFCSTTPRGQTNESRVGTFMYQYAKQILARNDFGTREKRQVAFNKLASSWRDTNGFAQGVYALWNSYMKSSFPTGAAAADLPNPCGSTDALKASDTIANAFQCVRNRSTLTEEPMTP